MTDLIKEQIQNVMTAKELAEMIMVHSVKGNVVAEEICTNAFNKVLSEIALSTGLMRSIDNLKKAG